VEARLVAEVRQWHDAMRADPARLAWPLCILVPSRSLKDHVSAVLVRELGTLAGVAVQTHHGTALQILERSGERAPAGSQLLPVLARQCARDVSVLRVDLDDLDDGYGSVESAVSDLLDAGLDETTAAPVRERLAAGRGAAWTRAAGVAEVALAVQASLREHGLGRLADVLVRAREALEAEPELFAPGRLLVHGFADATGLVSDFLTALLRGRQTLVLLDRPPDPADPGALDLGASFLAPLEATLAEATGSAPEGDGEAPLERSLRLFRAPGTDAEVRAVSQRIASLLAARERPEGIGIVTRTPALYAASLRIQLARLGIPASGVAVPGPRSALGRRVAFLIDLLRQRERIPADRFVLALHGLGSEQCADLRLGLHALGVARLADLAAGDVDAPFGAGDFFPLPVRRGLATDPEREGDEVMGGPESSLAEEDRSLRFGPRARRRALGRRLLLRARDAARGVLERLASASDARPLGERLAALPALLADGLGWRHEGPEAPLFARLESLRNELPDALPVSFDALALLLERSLAGLAHEKLAGEGGGVQILDVTEARARTFEHLFVLGLNRDHFPRVVVEDPLLPDEIRRPLRQILPELAPKERGHEEERYLFAELVSASPDVTISWQILGDDGKAKAPSPLIERLLSPSDEVERVPTLQACPDLVEPSARAAVAEERPAHEWALLAGLYGRAADAAALLPAALAEARGHAGERHEPSVRVAALRRAAVAELDASRPEDPRLGPYFGHVGPIREAADLRHGALWVTTVEKVARCPWQGFLAKLLRLEPPADALEALPEADGLLVGSLVHDVLERIAREKIPETPSVGNLSEMPSVTVPWPDDARVEALLQEEARKLLFRNGIGLEGFGAVLVEVARPYLVVAREVEWGGGPLPVVGAELTAELELATPHGAVGLRFRADRVDLDAEGLILTDYKTGHTLKDARRPDTRFAALRNAVREGRALQAPAYARVAPGARGRYLYLEPDVREDSREYRVSGERELTQAFEAVVSEVAGAFEAGTFPPRLVDGDGDEPKTCQWCELSVACLRGDSGARRRLASWAAAPVGDDARARALRGIWALGRDAPIATGEDPAGGGDG